MGTEIFANCYTGYLEKVKEIVEENENVNILNERGENLLHITARQDHIKIAWFLIRKGIKVNVKSVIGDTPLHNACKNHHMDLVKYIYRFGGNFREKNEEGKTPLEYLTKKERIQFYDFKDRFLGLGKYAYKPKPETPHIFMGKGTN